MKNTLHLIAATSCAALFFSCQSPVNNKVDVLTTSADGAHQLEATTVEFLEKAQEGAIPVTINPEEQFQTMDGFGYAITYSSCYNLLKMSDSLRHELLKQTYDVKEGYGASYARISIGCNDFSSTEYTLCDEPGLEHFRLYTDETDYVIPVLKEILEINPDLKIIAAPWTAPKWIKVDNIESMQPHDSWTDGHVNPQMYDTYAEYFVKFIETFQEQGIRIYAVSPQNEPLNPGNCASTYIPWQEEAPLVKAMAAAFKKHALDTKIYVFDHNYNYDDKEDQIDYPVQIYKTLGNNFEGAEYVVGAAYHDYGGHPSELEDITAQAPEKEVIFTESSIGTWNKGRDLPVRLMKDMENLVLGTVNRNCKAVLVWNFMLDTNRGPNLDGGCQTCYGAIDINPENYTEYTLNSHYYVITHMSAVVQPGAVRIACNVPDETILTAAFQNPDGTLSVVMNNLAEEEKQVSVQLSEKTFCVTLPARSVVSCKW